MANGMNTTSQKYAQNFLKFSTKKDKSSIFLPDDVHLTLEWKPSYDYKADIMSQSPDISHAGWREL